MKTAVHKLIVLENKIQSLLLKETGKTLRQEELSQFVVSLHLRVLYSIFI